MANWNNKESLGTSYIYCSKNAADDVAASNFFGKAAAWVSATSYVIGNRVTSVSIQYVCILATSGTTAPASDATHWSVDKANFQPYISSQTYNIGDKCTTTTHHWIAAQNGITGAFDSTKWTDTIISNSSAPYKLMNTAIVMQNADARFVSSEVLDTVNNIATQLIWLVLSNGVWNESLTNASKSIRVVGQSNQKTVFASLSLWSGAQMSNMFLDTLYITSNPTYGVSSTCNLKIQNCVMYWLKIENYNNVLLNISFCYRNIIQNFSPSNSNPYNVCYIGHFVSNTVLSMVNNISSVLFSYNSYSIFRNNYIKGTPMIGTSTGVSGLNAIQIGSFDYNCFDGNPVIGTVSQTSLTMLKTTVPNQNNNSIYSTITLNTDYTLQAGSALVGAGSNGNNIGAEGVGYVKTNSDIWDSANGATYKNIIKVGPTLTRKHISKTLQSATSNTAVLDSTLTVVDNEMNGFRIYTSAGTGAGQTKNITATVGSTKTVTISGSWSVTPDNTTIYEILDGSITSAIGDLGSISTIKKINLNTSNIFDGTGYIITQSVSETDPRLDNPAAITFDLKANNDSGLAGATTYRFVSDDYLKIDNTGKGCGDSGYTASNVVSNTLTFRYYQMTLNFQK